MSRCPHCNGKIELVAKSPREPGVFEFAPPANFDSVAAGVADDWTQAPLASKREKPSRPLNKWDILYPLSRGVITGVVFGVPALAAALVAEAALPFAWSGAAFWLSASKEWLGWNVYDFVMSVEEKLQRDINQDGRIGQPQAEETIERVSVWLNQKSDDGQTITDHLQLPLDRTKLADFANFILDGGTLSRDAVTGAGILSQGDYNKLLSEFERRGFVARVGKTNNRELTAAGRALLQRLR